MDHEIVYFEYDAAGQISVIVCRSASLDTWQHHR
jgi:hypothetical protein